MSKRYYRNSLIKLAIIYFAVFPSQGGAFYFLEHVVSGPSSWTYFLQHVLEPLWYYLGDGCRITRATWKDLESAGFSELHLSHIEAPEVTSMIRPHIMGYSIKWLKEGIWDLILPLVGLWRYIVTTSATVIDIMTWGQVKDCMKQQWMHPYKYRRPAYSFIYTQQNWFGNTACIKWWGLNRSVGIMAVW